MSPPTLLSGFRPTGRLHLGHLHGTLKNWVKLQADYRSFFFVADWHALTTAFEQTEGIARSTREMVADWLAVGLDPERSVIFRQSSILEHAELFLIFAMITPTPWLLRNPTVKEQARELGLIASDDDAELAKINFGHLGYPVLQAADILVYKADKVPVGADQVPHVEVTREIARRFNHLYRPVFPEPDALLSEVPKIAGLDGRKMSKSYNNAVFLSEPPADVEAKLSRMMTDPRRKRRTDPGDPADCPAYQSFHKIYCTTDELAEVDRGCKSASIGCLDCKRIMIRHVLADLEPIRERRREIDARPALVDAVLDDGNRRARAVASATMGEVRAAVGLD
ncbi:MAG: tryptophan--tRNA ligase [Deltaproteobacteria bacterium]|nr:tryptophan--tRNA ligase [Deltaproteobacteria bacterium]